MMLSILSSGVRAKRAPPHTTPPIHRTGPPLQGPPRMTNHTRCRRARPCRKVANASSPARTERLVRVPTPLLLYCTGILPRAKVRTGPARPGMPPHRPSAPESFQDDQPWALPPSAPLPDGHERHQPGQEDYFQSPSVSRVLKGFKRFYLIILFSLYCGPLL